MPRRVVITQHGFQIPTTEMTVQRRVTVRTGAAWSELNMNLGGLGVLKAMVDVPESLYEVLDEAADIVEEAAVGFAPEDTGWLKKNIFSDAIVDDEMRAVIRVGVRAEDVPYAAFQEFGTSRNRAHPYLRPAIDTTRYRVVQLVAKDLTKLISREVARGLRNRRS